jgi:hypothetical protein
MPCSYKGKTQLYLKKKSFGGHTDPCVLVKMTTLRPCTRLCTLTIQQLWIRDYLTRDDLYNIRNRWRLLTEQLY